MPPKTAKRSSGLKGKITKKSSAAVSTALKKNASQASRRSDASKPKKAGKKVNVHLYSMCGKRIDDINFVLREN
jgi:hypothetical protein